MFRHRCSDVRLSYDIPGSALLVFKLTPSRADLTIFGFRSQSAVCLREGMSPVGSPGLSWIFAGLQKSTTPRTPSGPRLAVQVPRDRSPALVRRRTHSNGAASFPTALPAGGFYLVGTRGLDFFADVRNTDPLDGVQGKGQMN